MSIKITLFRNQTMGLSKAMMRKILTITTAALAFGILYPNSAAALDEAKEARKAAIKDAIEKNEFEKIRGLFPDSEGINNLCPLGFALAFSAQDKICRDDIISYLIEKGADPLSCNVSAYNFPEVTLKQAVESMCPITVAAVISKASNSAIEQLGHSITFPSLSYSSNPDEVKKQNTQRKNAREIAEILEKRLKPLCPDLDDSRVPSCNALYFIAMKKTEDQANEKNEMAFQERALKEKKELEANAAKVKREEAEEAGPVGTKRAACYNQSVILAANAAIAKQEEIAKVSGFVNKGVMYEAGEAIVNNKKELLQNKAKYRKQTGKELDLATCSSEQR